MTESDRRVEILTESVLDRLGKEYAFDRARLSVVRDGVKAGFDKLDWNEKPLYFFNMNRFNLLEGEDLTKERVETAKKTYMRVIAEDQKAACIEAGRISGNAGEGFMWLFITESISPVLPPDYLR